MLDLSVEEHYYPTNADAGLHELNKTTSKYLLKDGISPVDDTPSIVILTYFFRLLFCDQS